MERERFKIALDDERKIATATVVGLWDLSDVAGCKSKLTAAQDMLGAAAQDYAMLVDLRDCTVQSREVSEEMQRVMADFRLGARRIAFVIQQSTLLKLQVVRISQGFEAEVFSSIEDAEAWLSDRS